MDEPIRPLLVKVFAALLLLAAILMSRVGLDAHGYLVPAACLLLQAALLWFGRALPVFTWIMLLNQVAGIVLILVLWLGDGLGHMKLDISGVSLLINLLCGGPLMSLLSIPLLALLRLEPSLPAWFRHA